MIRPPFSAPSPPPPTLTPRQAEVAALVAEGLSRRGIAAKLGMCESTVKRHMENISLRLNGPGTLRERVVRYIRDHAREAMPQAA